MDSIKMKICTRCKEQKPLMAFHKAPRLRSGLSSQCKACCYVHTKEWVSRNREKTRAAQRRFRANHPTNSAEYEIKRNYGISLEAYERMFREQNGGCKICGRQNLDGKRLSIDHDHNTGTVRGLLCIKCNSGIGYFRDDPNLMNRAIQYLKDNDTKEIPL